MLSRMTPTSRRQRLAAPIVAALAVVAVVFAVAGPATAAKPKQTQGEESCRINTEEGAYFLPPGTTITIDVGDGLPKEVYVCRNGKWEKKESKLLFPKVKTLTSVNYQTVVAIRDNNGNPIGPVKKTLGGNGNTDRKLYGISTSPGSVKKRTLDGNSSSERALYGVSTSPGKTSKRTLDNNTSDRKLYGVSSSPGRTPKRTLSGNANNDRSLYGFGTSPGKKRTLDNNSSTTRALDNNTTTV